jgi:hypothetical protein
MADSPPTAAAADRSAATLRRHAVRTLKVWVYVFPPAVSRAVNTPVSGAPPPPRPPRPRPPPAATGVHSTLCIPAEVANGSGVGRQSDVVFGMPPPPPRPPRPPAAIVVAGALEKVATTATGGVENLDRHRTGRVGLQIVVDRGAVARIGRLRLILLQRRAVIATLRQIHEIGRA